MLAEQEQVYMNVWTGIDRLLDAAEWDAATRIGEWEAQKELRRVKCNDNITRYLKGISKRGCSKLLLFKQCLVFNFD